MRIKEEFKKLGYFWRPSEPNKRLPGTLSISDGGNIELEVLHQLGDMSPPFSDVRFGGFDGGGKRIVGVIENNDIVNNKMVTLENCYYKSLGSGSLATSLIHADTVFIGVASYDEDDTALFKSLTFSVEGIDEWIGRRFFNVDLQNEEGTRTISCQPPADVSLCLNNNGMRLLIKFRCSEVMTIPEYRMSQETYFTLISQEACKLDDFILAAQQITYFLCFAMNQTVSLYNMSATSGNLRQDIGDDKTRAISMDIYRPTWPYSKDEPKIDQYGMLFGFEKIQNDAEGVINNWIEAYEQRASAFDLYFLAKMGRQTYLEERFLALAQGLEAYFDCYYFRDNVKAFIEPFKEVIGDEDKRDLEKEIVGTRNYLTHRNPEKESEASKGKDLGTLCLKMEWLFQHHFLQLIGFSREQIDTLLTKGRFTRR